VFAIELCAYAVMSNHYHVVLRIDTQKAGVWSDSEVALRWKRLFAGPNVVHRWLEGSTLNSSEREHVSELIAIWRERLMSLSWFMRCMNEAIARLANAEDKCTGRFWEGRFKSQALLDEKALLTCMAYVDLNPIRAAIANTPEDSDYTSIQQRIKGKAPESLRPFGGRSNDDVGLPGSLERYFELVDWAGRAVRSGRRGYIPADTPPILTRLGLQPGSAVDFLRCKQDFPRAIGPLAVLRELALSVGVKFFRGVTATQWLYQKAA
jgi:REP element-mobilizing transposase RayT